MPHDPTQHTDPAADYIVPAGWEETDGGLSAPASGRRLDGLVAGHDARGETLIVRVGDAAVKSELSVDHPREF